MTFNSTQNTTNKNENKKPYDLTPEMFLGYFILAPFILLFKMLCSMLIPVFFILCCLTLVFLCFFFNTVTNMVSNNKS